MRRALAALTLLTAHAANIASELEAFVDAAAAPAQTAQSAAPAQPAPASDRVVFVKTYKTGSTTVSEFLAQIGYARGLHALHPSESGHFKEGELRRRADRGERFDLSFRHPTPTLDVPSLGRLVPNARWCTIMREPVSRFISTMRFVRRLDERFRGNAAALVDSIQKKRLPDGDANTFCNNVAWVLSGEQRTLAYGVSREEQLAAAAAITARLDAQQTLVLMQKDMAASLALLASSLNWDLAASPARLRSARVARGRRGAARCEDAACRNAVLACNAADSQLYETYERRFDAEIARRAGDERFRANRRAVVAAPARNAPPFASKYPINCQQPNTGPPERRRWKLLNSCGGRVD